jgi:hypothetical protein
LFSGRTADCPFAHVTVMLWGAREASESCVMMKCHSLLSHSWSMRALAEIVWVAVCTVTGSSSSVVLASTTSRSVSIAAGSGAVDSVGVVSG